MNFDIGISVHNGFEDISGISRTIRIFLSIQIFFKTPPSKDTKFSMYTSEKLQLVMAILQSVCYGTLVVLVDHSSPSYRHRMEMIIAVPEWLIELLMGILLCAGPNSPNSRLKSRNTPKPIIDGVHCSKIRCVHPPTCVSFTFLSKVFQNMALDAKQSIYICSIELFVAHA